jgi:beta-glucanase (GH16 family)
MKRAGRVLGGILAALTILTGCTNPAPRDTYACDTQARRSEGPWTCTFADDFEGSRLDRTAWAPQKWHGSGTPQARACFVDRPDTIAVRDGRLWLTVRKATRPVTCDGTPADYVSGNVSTYHRFSQMYGRFAARVRVHPTKAPGLQEAFWLWPDDRVRSAVAWPAAGEIDIAETYSNRPGLAIPFLHYTVNDNGGPRPGLNTAWRCKVRRGVDNTYELIWTPRMLRIVINGRTCLTNPGRDPAFRKPYIVVLSSALGIDTNALTPRAPIPATMSVDWVRVWRWTGPGAS